MHLLQKGTDSIQHQLNLYLIRSFKRTVFYGEEAVNEYFDECFLVPLLVLLPLRSQGLAAWGQKHNKCARKGNKK